MRLFVFSLTALIAASGGASAQSVLERVLGQIDGASNLAQVNGVYTNIAESVLGSETLTRDVPYDVNSDFTAAASSDVVVTVTDDLGNSYDITRGQFPPAGAIHLDPGTTGLSDQLRLWFDGRIDPINSGADNLISFYGVNDTLLGQVWADSGDMVNGLIYTETLSQSEAYQSPVSTVIDGSITNLITGVTAATAEAIAGASSATEFVMPTVDLGDLSTTALGAVNTGEITLGVNSVVGEAATSTTRAIAAAMTQIGGAADMGALVLNLAHNASTVNGSIQNTMLAVNGSIGSASTTALGAVNTGTITSGVNAAVQGIVGMTGQTSSGL
ncbi:hypothetical protein [Phaeobacter gallaeciensis]|uniref:hypothetical protein n=1 Tax=Phaeobacter gallaeciensis TaxID=60890 RepID=UPI00237F4023|nr:hypothetical protein [Phaeobacter gallaeciensis]MDE4061911.1 hypothetical protein [Phaeobacter gallaeciensis]MDE4124901.1 hypothetical protein [Phaeobacter gallaeciensis]MDE4129373.1 hypothetical protein [Phaeobacter gallaeciensis]